jgi:hypothetical protein
MRGGLLRYAAAPSERYHSTPLFAAIRDIQAGKTALAQVTEAMF